MSTEACPPIEVTDYDDSQLDCVDDEMESPRKPCKPCEPTQIDQTSLLAGLFALSLQVFSIKTTVLNFWFIKRQ